TTATSSKRFEPNARCSKRSPPSRAFSWMSDEAGSSCPSAFGFSARATARTSHPSQAASSCTGSSAIPTTRRAFSSPREGALSFCRRRPRRAEPPPGQRALLPPPPDPRPPLQPESEPHAPHRLPEQWPTLQSESEPHEPHCPLEQRPFPRQSE